METAHMEHVLDNVKPDFGMDASNPNYFDTLAGMDYLQYPQSPFGVGNMGCKYSHHCLARL